MSDLAILLPFFNPCGYKTLKKNAEICTRLLSKSSNNVYFIECEYTGHAEKLSSMTSPSLPWNVSRLKIKTGSILFAKEALLNAGLKQLPEKFTKVLFLDCDILFEEKNFLQVISETLNSFDVIQPFAYASWLDEEGKEIKSNISWAKSFIEQPFSDETKMFKAHGGFGFAAKKQYIKNGLFPFAVLGSGDEIHMRIASGLSVNCDKFSYMKEELLHYAASFSKPRFGFAPLKVKHLWHGKLLNRKYVKRHFEASSAGFNVSECLEIGGIMPEFKDYRWNTYFFSYFLSRDEDGDRLKEKNIQKSYCCLPAETDPTINPLDDVLVDVRTGLFNRLRVLMASLWECEGTVWCHWPINSECDTPLQAFAFIPSKVIMIDDPYKIAKNLTLDRIIGDLNLTMRAPGPLKVLNALKSSPPQNFGLLFQSLKFQRNVVERAKGILSDITSPSYGFHIRRCDSLLLAKSLGKILPSVQEYTRIASMAQGYQIVLCTDDEDVVELFRRRFKTRLTILSDPRQSKIVTTSHGTRKNAGIEIVSDAIVLSKCDEFMGTPTSSISETIELWRKCDFKI